MSILTAPIYNLLSADGPLTAMLATYGGEPAIFTTFPTPGDATLPYIVTAGEAVATNVDTKTTRIRELFRDVKVFAAPAGGAEDVEQIADRVYDLLHRRELTIDGYEWVLSECLGPITADERDAYGRVLTLRTIIEQIGWLLIDHTGDHIVDHEGNIIDLGL